jgi:small subunit ribosomal protein S16
MVAIRLRREGNKNRPFYRIVAVTHTKKRDGGYIECLGTYDPVAKADGEKLDLAATDKWLANGARPSETVASIIKRARRAAKVAAAAV